VKVRRIFRRPAATAAALLAVPLLASCGFDAPTTAVYNPPVGVMDQSGAVDVLNVVVVSPTDGEGTLVAGLANNDPLEADELTDVQAAGSSSTVEVLVSGPTEIPAGGLLDLSDEGGVTVSGEPIVPGNFVGLTFTFENAAAITVEAPVVEFTDEGPYRHVPVE
jgi:hypothetical protein